MITDYDEARKAFEASMRDVGGGDEEAADVVVSVATQCDQETAYELCRTELGFVPFDVQRFFPGLRGRDPLDI